MKNPNNDEDKHSMLRNIIGSNADVNNQDSNGWTALHLACYTGDLISAEILV